MSKFQKRLEARKLRKRGLSIKGIAESLEVSKGSVSIWCRDISLTEKQKERLRENMIKAGHKGRMIGAAMNRQKKLDTIEFYKRLGKKEVGKLSKRDLIIAGTCLYWGEGSKSGSRFVFVNSDPEMILFIYRFLKEILAVKPEEFIIGVQINEIHRPRINTVLRFWSNLLELPRSQFGNPYFIKVKPKKVYKNYDFYHGILRLRVRKSANLQYKILGLIDALKQ